jgi:imidazolonepropionase
MLTLLSNIKQLIQFQPIEDVKTLVKGKDMNNLPTLDNAYLIIENSTIHSFGTMINVPNLQFDKTIDCTGKFVMPTWIDSHTHLVHAQYREQEFVDRINGLTYEEIAQKGGGILNSASKLSSSTESELFDTAWVRLQDAIQLGTGAIEIKSGYGLSVEAEIKMLRVIKQLKEKSSIPIKATFLGAHTFPLEYKQNHEGYLKLIIDKMLPQIAQEGLADYIDVFCEQGFFSVDETSRLLYAGSKYNLKAKIHANQLYKSGGVQIGVKHNALSVDHLESMGDEEIECLQNSSTLPVLLPGAAFFLNMHYQPARKMIDANLPIVLASDYNPGSCPSYNMNFVISLACTQMKMTPEEAINACTINAASALELEKQLGTIKVGKLANLIITKPIPSIAFMPYWYGQNVIENVIINGMIK